MFNAKCLMQNASGGLLLSCCIEHFSFCILTFMTTKKTAPLVCSFPPIASPGARVLILGTAPSIASLAKQQYYGHPQNAFWPIMGRLFGAERELPYEERRQILTGQGVAVWDVLRECYREGSLDTSIHVESETPNDIAGFLQSQPQVHSIFFNGGKAESAYRRHALRRVAQLQREFCYIRLPSTSPAHAGRTFAQKLAAWRAVSRALRRD
jgi:hypoxanthine-DNA glycosylase